MSKMSSAIAAFFIIAVSTSAIAQIKNNNIPAGTSSAILSGTPSGTSPGASLQREAQSVNEPVRSGRSSGCRAGGLSCGPLIAPDKPLHNPK